MMWKIIFILFLVMNILSCTSNKQQNSSENLSNKDSLFMLVGSYASAEEEGIKLYTFNQESGKVCYINGIKGISNPSYLTPSSDGTRVYAVSENEGENSSANALSLNLSDGTFVILNSELTQGAAPCYITLDKKEKFVLTANYLGGNISVFRLDEDGKLMSPRVISFVGHGVDPERQEKPHLHFIGFTPDEKYTVAVDLGTDCIHMFSINGQDRKEAVPFLNEDSPYNFTLPSGCGPRHLCFSPDNKYVYVITELSGEVLTLAYQGTDTRIIQTIKADTLGAKGSADIHLTPDGRFLYASNRLKGDGIAIFKVDSNTGMLEKVGYQSTGIHPRNFVISPNGRFLLVACRDTNEIQLFEIDSETGLLHNTGETIKVSKPTCLKFIRK